MTGCLVTLPLTEPRPLLTIVLQVQQNEMKLNTHMEVNILNCWIPYFDIVRYHVVDPMHNIFLGIAKHTLKTWKDLHIIDDKKDYAVIQEKVESTI